MPKHHHTQNLHILMEYGPVRFQKNKVHHKIFMKISRSWGLQPLLFEKSRGRRPRWCGLSLMGGGDCHGPAVIGFTLLR